MNNSPPPLRFSNVNRTYKTGDSSLTILDRADFTLNPGEIVALVAPSGSGKSTLLHLAGLLEYPDAGAVLINGIDTTTLADPERTKLRRDHIGFVYQFHHLLGEFSALENVVLAANDRPNPPPRRRQPRRRSARQPRPWPPPASPPRQTLRRRTATRRHRPRAGQQPQTPPRRRTHRQPRHRHRPPPSSMRCSPPSAPKTPPPSSPPTTPTLAARMDRRITLREGRVVSEK